MRVEEFKNECEAKVRGGQYTPKMFKQGGKNVWMLLELEIIIMSKR